MNQIVVSITRKDDAGITHFTANVEGPGGDSLEFKLCATVTSPEGKISTRTIDSSSELTQEDHAILYYFSELNLYAGDIVSLLNPELIK